MGDTRRPQRYADQDGSFRRPDSQFRNWISKESGAQFPPEKDRYALYVNYGCPWAHRTILVRGLKSLEPFIQLIVTDFNLTAETGWMFNGQNGSDPVDPLYGFTGMKQLYLKADPDYTGRYTVPVLWDKKTHTIVNNESSEIIRMLYDSFDEFLEPAQREVNKPGGGFYPPHLRAEIDDMNDWVYNTINNGVYKTGFAASQEAYDAAIFPLFKSLDRLEEHLADPEHRPYLFGEYITEADIRLYTTLARFDVAYHTIFKCNLKMIRHDYTRLSKWLRSLYWDTSDRTNGGVFKNTTNFYSYRNGYTKALGRQLHAGSDLGWAVITPHGPQPEMPPLTEEEEQELIHRTASKVNGGTISSTSHGDRSGLGAIFGAEVDPPSATTASNGAGNGEAQTGGVANSEPKPGLVRRTTHSEENAKWYKAAKKAEKASGAPSMHLAL